MDDFLKFITIGATLMIGFFLSMGVLSQGHMMGFGFILIFIFAVLALVVLSTPLQLFFRNLSESKTETQTDADLKTKNPVKKLQEQYVTGEISDEEFEHRLEMLSESQEVAEEIDEEPVKIGEQ